MVYWNHPRFIIKTVLFTVSFTETTVSVSAVFYVRCYVGTFTVNWLDKFRRVCRSLNTSRP